MYPNFSPMAATNQMRALVFTMSVVLVLTDPLLVKTKSGWVRGKTDTSVTGKPVLAFLGIPYAEPPLGHLRFLHPEPVVPWPDVFSATALPNSCMQRLLKIANYIPFLKCQVSMTPVSEDCLKLNIWVPSNNTVKVPVIVFIHGGGFSYGASATPINLGDALASEGKVIVVTLNYRLASFGFLYLDDPAAPGNAGLYDQRLALEWIHTNIEAFGGDPDNIVLYGQSAGAAGVLVHLIAGKSDHIINRIILSSVPRHSFVIVNRETMIQKAVQLAENVGCASDTSNTSATIECLKTVDPEDLIQSEPGQGYNNVVFYPVVDGDIVPEDWKQRFVSGKTKAVDVLIGSNRNEGTIFLMLASPPVFQPVRNEAKPDLEDYKEVLSLAELPPNLISKTVEFHYTGYIDESESNRILEACEKTVSDILFVCPMNRYARILGVKKLFRFHLVHTPASSKAPTWFGVFHGSDLFYVFGHLWTASPKLPQRDLEFASRIMRYWTNFARTGDPNIGPDGSREVITWPASTPTDSTYLVLSPNSTSAGRAYRAKHCALWDMFLPEMALQLGIHPNQTYRFLGF